MLAIVSDDPFSLLKLSPGKEIKGTTRGKGSKILFSVAVVPRPIGIQSTAALATYGARARVKKRGLID